MPPNLTAATGMDALTHAVEAYVSTAATPLTDACAIKAIGLIAESLRPAVANGGDMDAREKMCYARYLAGMAFNNANLGHVHAMAHQLGGFYDLPHRVCNAILLPHVAFCLLPAGKSSCSSCKWTKAFVCGTGCEKGNECHLIRLPADSRQLSSQQDLKEAYMDKILRIDVSGGQPSFREEGRGDYAGLGGRALTSAVVHAEVPADCHPLGPENKFVIAPGLLSGSSAANSGRLSVGCKSPLTGGIKEANTGGQAAQVLARLGYAAIVLEGERSGGGLYVVRINSDGVRIEKDNSLKMLTNYQLADRFRDEYIKKGSMISIGTAGEMLMANSTVASTDPEGRPTRHAGRGGAGAVMGSKGIKAILFDGNGTSVLQPKNPEEFKKANKTFTQGLKDHPVTGQGLPAYGTNVLTNIVNEAGAFPAYNFRSGQYGDAEKISGETQAELESSRGGNPTHGCHRGCVIRCSGTFVDKDGRFVSKQPEYETVWSHGGNCGICDLDSIATLDFLDDDYGFDTIEMGTSIGVAMEAGLIDSGDAGAAINLVHEAGKGTPLGRILGSGTETVARAFGIERAPEQVIRQEIQTLFLDGHPEGLKILKLTSRKV